MCLGKAMGGGVMPIGALLGSERAMGGFDDVPTGSTWAWLPASCAAALATLDVFEREPVLENVRALDARAHETLARLPERHPAIGDVRIKGCFMAVEFVRDRVTKERAPDIQEAVADRVHAPRAAGRLQHHVVQHPAVAGDACRGARPGRGDRRRGDCYRLRVTAPTVEPFTDDHIAAAGALLAERHREQRQVEPLLPARYEEPAEAAGPGRGRPGARRAPPAPLPSATASSPGT